MKDQPNQGQTLHTQTRFTSVYPCLPFMASFCIKQRPPRPLNAIWMATWHGDQGSLSFGWVVGSKFLHNLVEDWLEWNRTRWSCLEVCFRSTLQEFFLSYIFLHWKNLTWLLVNLWAKNWVVVVCFSLCQLHLPIRLEFGWIWWVLVRGH